MFVSPIFLEPPPWWLSELISLLVALGMPNTKLTLRVCKILIVWYDVYTSRTHPSLNIRTHSLTIPIFYLLEPKVLSDSRVGWKFPGSLATGSTVLQSTFKHAEQAQPFKHTDGTGVSYYLRGLAVWPALHMFKWRYRKYMTIMCYNLR